MNGLENDIELIRDLIEWADSNAARVAKSIGVANTTINRFANGSAKTRLGRDTLNRLKEQYPDYPGFLKEPDLPAMDDRIEYVPVDVLPTYAGMGGGGTGDGDKETALVPRALIEDMLRGKAPDFLLINVRGDSMEGDFRHGDQLLVDTRDRSPTQPGPFALWFDDEYVVKNVERIPGGQVRIFSSNPKYSTVSLATEETKIIGRPVWFGRRL